MNVAALRHDLADLGVIRLRGFNALMTKNFLDKRHGGRVLVQDDFASQVPQHVQAKVQPAILHHVVSERVVQLCLCKVAIPGRVAAVFNPNTVRAWVKMRVSCRGFCVLLRNRQEVFDVVFQHAHRFTINTDMDLAQNLPFLGRNDQGAFTISFGQHDVPIISGMAQPRVICAPNRRDILPNPRDQGRPCHCHMCELRLLASLDRHASQPPHG